MEHRFVFLDDQLRVFFEMCVRDIDFEFAISMFVFVNHDVGCSSLKFDITILNLDIGHWTMMFEMCSFCYFEYGMCDFNLCDSLSIVEFEFVILNVEF